MADSPEPPPSVRAGPRPSSAMAPGIAYHDQQRRASAAGPQVRWRRELLRVPMMRVQAWERASPRQRLLVALAALSLLAAGAVLVTRLMVDRALPQQVRGMWRTDSPVYVDRAFELRQGRIAFLTGDSAQPVTVRAITRVRRDQDRDGELFTVEFRQEGETVAFGFVYRQGPPEEILFAHQRRLIWRRWNTTRSLMPEGF